MHPNEHKAILYMVYCFQIIYVIWLFMGFVYFIPA